jgi:hypothetical protein
MRATDAARLICDLLNVWHQDDRREVLVILTQLVEAERERCRGCCAATKPHWHKSGCYCSECVTADDIAGKIESGSECEEKTTDHEIGGEGG